MFDPSHYEGDEVSELQALRECVELILEYFEANPCLKVLDDLTTFASLSTAFAGEVLIYPGLAGKGFTVVLHYDEDGESDHMVGDSSSVLAVLGSELEKKG